MNIAYELTVCCCLVLTFYISQVLAGGLKVFITVPVIVDNADEELI